MLLVEVVEVAVPREDLDEEIRERKFRRGIWKRKFLPFEVSPKVAAYSVPLEESLKTCALKCSSKCSLKCSLECPLK